MTTLFLAQTTKALNTISAQIGDAVLLLNDGVALACGRNAEQLRERLGDSTPLLVLDDDLQLRGLTLNALMNIDTINYDQFVALTIHHHQIQSC